MLLSVVLRSVGGERQCYFFQLLSTFLHLRVPEGVNCVLKSAVRALYDASSTGKIELAVVHVALYPFFIRHYLPFSFSFLHSCVVARAMYSSIVFVFCIFVGTDEHVHRYSVGGYNNALLFTAVFFVFFKMHGELMLDNFRIDFDVKTTCRCRKEKEYKKGARLTRVNPPFFEHYDGSRFQPLNSNTLTLGGPTKLGQKLREVCDYCVALSSAQ